MEGQDGALKKRFRYWLQNHPKIDVINDYLRWILLSKKVFTPPHKSQILLYDASLKNTIYDYISKWNPEILHVRAEFLNIYVLFRSFFLKGEINFQNYVDEYIRCVKPSLILTMTDNKYNFYTIGSNHKIKTLFIQNALRGTEVFSEDAIKRFKNSCQSFQVDYMCVHGITSGSTYNKFIEGTTIHIGSLKNNHIKKKEKFKPDTIAVISHFRSKSSPGFKSKIFTKTNRIVLDFLSDYTQIHQKEFQIICNTSTKDERDVFKDILDGRECVFIDQPNRHGYTSYNAVDNAEVVIGMGSTLTYESAARGNKTAFLFIVDALFRNDPGTRYGYPEKVPDVGPYWTNIPDRKIFKKILDHLFEITTEEWEKELELTNFSRYMEYDPGNTRLKEILNQELEDPENQKDFRR